ncbi:MAG: hypothetical protein AB7O28_12000 [Vicinamibacterales bacterium]
MALRILLLVVLALLALRAVGRFVMGLAQGASPGAPPAGAAAAAVKMAKDPVCGTFVVPGKAIAATSNGATVWFCSERCRDEFARRS